MRRCSEYEGQSRTINVRFLFDITENVILYDRAFCNIQACWIRKGDDNEGE